MIKSEQKNIGRGFTIAMIGVFIGIIADMIPNEYLITFLVANMLGVLAVFVGVFMLADGAMVTANQPGKWWNT